MPQPTSLSIGFSEEDLARLRSLTKIIGVSQRAIVSALLAIPQDDLVRIVKEHAAKVSIEKAKKKELDLNLKKKIMGFSAEQLAKIEAFLDAQ